MGFFFLFKNLFSFFTFNFYLYSSVFLFLPSILVIRLLIKDIKWVDPDGRAGGEALRRVRGKES